MVYIKIVATTPFTGTAFIEYKEFEERPTDAELNKIVEKNSRGNAESYEYLVCGLEDGVFEDEKERAEALEEFYADCLAESSWVEITREQFEEENL